MTNHKVIATVHTIVGEVLVPCFTTEENRRLAFFLQYHGYEGFEDPQDALCTQGMRDEAVDFSKLTKPPFTQVKDDFLLLEEKIQKSHTTRANHTISFTCPSFTDPQDTAEVMLQIDDKDTITQVAYLVKPSGRMLYKTIYYIFPQYSYDNNQPYGFEIADILKDQQQPTMFRYDSSDRPTGRLLSYIFTACATQLPV